jgi:hypothetical protein
MSAMDIWQHNSWLSTNVELSSLATSIYTCGVPGTLPGDSVQFSGRDPKMMQAHAQGFLPAGPSV